MNDSRLPTILFCVLLLFAVLECVHVYPQLPDVMTSHFTGRGVPNGWQPKPAFFLLFGVVIVVGTIPASSCPACFLRSPKTKSIFPISLTGLPRSAVSDPGAPSAGKWPGGAALFSFFCCTGCPRRSTRIFPESDISTGRACGTRSAAFYSSRRFGSFTCCAIFTASPIPGHRPMDRE